MLDGLLINLILFLCRQPAPLVSGWFLLRLTEAQGWRLQQTDSLWSGIRGNLSTKGKCLSNVTLCIFNEGKPSSIPPWPYQKRKVSKCKYVGWFICTWKVLWFMCKLAKQTSRWPLPRQPVLHSKPLLTYIWSWLCVFCSSHEVEEVKKKHFPQGPNIVTFSLLDIVCLCHTDPS